MIIGPNKSWKLRQAHINISEKFEGTKNLLEVAHNKVEEAYKIIKADCIIELCCKKKNRFLIFFQFFIFLFLIFFFFFKDIKIYNEKNELISELTGRQFEIMGIEKFHQLYNGKKARPGIYVGKIFFFFLIIFFKIFSFLFFFLFLFIYFFFFLKKSL